MGFWSFLKRLLLEEEERNRVKESDRSLSGEKIEKTNTDFEEFDYLEEKMRKTRFKESDYVSDYDTLVSDSDHSQRLEEPDYITDPAYSFLPFNIFHDIFYGTSNAILDNPFHDNPFHKTSLWDYDLFHDSSHDTFRWDDDLFHNSFRWDDDHFHDSFHDTFNWD